MAVNLDLGQVLPHHRLVLELVTVVRVDQMRIVLGGGMDRYLDLII